MFELQTLLRCDRKEIERRGKEKERRKGGDREEVERR
jgi:hypothetical protein